MIEAIFFNPWVWITPIFLVVATVLTVIGIIRMRQDDMSSWFVGILVGGMAFLVVAPLYFGWILPPYDSSFYQTYRITGEITEIQSAFSGGEGTMSQVFISRVEGVESFIKSDDQRFRTLEVGDEVNFVCSKGFAYFQEPWYDCNFAG